MKWTRQWARTIDYGGDGVTLISPVMMGLVFWSVEYDDGAHFGRRWGICLSLEAAHAKARREVVRQHFIATS